MKVYCPILEFLSLFSKTSDLRQGIEDAMILNAIRNCSREAGGFTKPPHLRFQILDIKEGLESDDKPALSNALDDSASIYGAVESYETVDEACDQALSMMVDLSDTEKIDGLSIEASPFFSRPNFDSFSSRTTFQAPRNSVGRLLPHMH
jgi:hypothetical protein